MGAKAKCGRMVEIERFIFGFYFYFNTREKLTVMFSGGGGFLTADDRR
jgi:hypothetical protein